MEMDDSLWVLHEFRNSPFSLVLLFSLRMLRDVHATLHSISCVTISMQESHKTGKKFFDDPLFLEFWYSWVRAAKIWREIQTFLKNYKDVAKLTKLLQNTGYIVLV